MAKKTTAKKTAKKKSQVCGGCKKPGHNARTCTAKSASKKKR